MGGMRRLAEITDPRERDLADQIDREVRAASSLLALVLCLSITVGLFLAGVMTLARAI
jgi:hypothetical protein